MPDNTVLNGTTVPGGDTFRDVLKNGVKTPVSLIDVGGAGAEALVSAANPLPVTIGAGAATDANLTAVAGAPGDTPPALANNASGLIGWLRAVVSALAGTLTVAGNAASGAADSGNPVKVGGVYNSLFLPLASGRRCDLQLDSGGSLKVNLNNSTVTLPVTLQGSLTGGTTPYHLVTAASTNATSVKGSGGIVYGYSAFNTSASPRFLKLFDKAAAPVPGTDTPVLTVLIPPNNGGVVKTFAVGVQFNSGIAFAVTAGIADLDAVAVGANECVVNLTYK